MSKSNLSRSSSSNLICESKNLVLTNHSLILSLNSAYEKGREDGRKINFGSFFFEFFSISITLFITFFTCDSYKTIGETPDFVPRLIVFVIAVAFLILGISSSCYASINSNKSFFNQRDNAVKMVIKEIKFSKNIDSNE